LGSRDEIGDITSTLKYATFWANRLYWAKPKCLGEVVVSGYLLRGESRGIFLCKKFSIKVITQIPNLLEINTHYFGYLPVSPAQPVQAVG